MIGCMEKMYLFLSSKDCIDKYPGNNAWDFTVDIGKVLNLKGTWQCSLVQIQYPDEHGDLYVYSDLCEPSYVADNFLPILRIVNKPTCTFSKSFFMNMSREHISHVKIYIRKRWNEVPSFSTNITRCTLQLRKL